MTGVCVGLKPQNIEDITAIIALYRPGPMESIPRFIACKHNPDKVTYKHPALEPILSSHLRLHRLPGAGHPDLPAAGRATPWARPTWCAGPSPKRRKAQIEKERQTFLHGDPERSIAGCVANGIPEQTGRGHLRRDLRLCQLRLQQGPRGVPTPSWPTRPPGSSATTPRSIWPPCSPPCWTPARRWRSISPSARSAASSCCPRTSTSRRPTSPCPGEHIRFGLVAVKGVGRGFINAVLDEREQGRALSGLSRTSAHRMFDADLNKRVLESLIKCGAFDSMGVPPLPADGGLCARWWTPSPRPGARTWRASSICSAAAGTQPQTAPELHLPEHPGVHPPGADDHGEGDHRPLPHRPPHGRVPGDGHGGARRSPSGPSCPTSPRRTGPTDYQDEQRVTIAGVISAVQDQDHPEQHPDGLCHPGGRHRLHGAAGASPGCWRESGSYLKENMPVAGSGEDLRPGREGAPADGGRESAPLDRPRRRSRRASGEAEALTSACPARTTPAAEGQAGPVLFPGERVLVVLVL